MNKLIIVVVEDEKFVCELLVAYINEVLETQEKEIITCKNVQSAKILIESKKPDLVFLDIHLQDGNGFDLLNELDEKSFELVFTTAYSEYMEQSINDIGCLGYLLKPIDINKLRIIFDRFKEKVSKHKQIKLITGATNKKISVDLNEIVYCEADNNYSLVHMYNTEKPLFSSISFGKMVDSLPDNFKKIHRSYLINTNYIESYDASKGVVILKSNNQKLIEISVSNSHRRDIGDLFL